jgi:hypothetical protein
MHRAILTAAVFSVGLFLAAGATAAPALETTGSEVSPAQSGTKTAKSPAAKRPRKAGQG